MAGRFKFVCVAMVVTLFVSQGEAPSACRIPMPAMQEMAMGDAGITANTAVGIQQGLASSSCCELSAANAAVAAAPRAPEYGVTRLATTTNTSILKAPRAPIRSAPAKAPPRGLGFSLHATFCTFLI